MSEWVTGQSFTAEADGLTTDFITQDAYIPGQITPFQGSIRINYASFFELSTTQIRFIDSDTRAAATADADTDVLTSASHGRSNGDVITFSATITLPSGLSKATKYYIINKTDDTFQVSLTLGGSAVELTSAESGILYFAVPEAPILANGLLYYDAFIGTAASVEDVGPWNVDDFQAWYGLGSLASTILYAALDRADQRVQGYISAACYTDAIDDDPDDAAFASLVKYTIADLALFYLQQQGIWKGAAKEYTESYAGIKKYSEKYDTSGIDALWSEADILARLDECTTSGVSNPVYVEWGDNQDEYEEDSYWEQEYS